MKLQVLIGISLLSVVYAATQYGIRVNSDTSGGRSIGTEVTIEGNTNLVVPGSASFGSTGSGVAGSTIKMFNTNGTYQYWITPNPSQSANLRQILASGPGVSIYTVSSTNEFETRVALPSDASQFLNGTGAFSTPSGVPSTAQYAGSILTPWVLTNGSISLVWRKPPVVEEFIGATTLFGITGILVNSGTATIPTTTSDLLEGGLTVHNTAANTNGLSGLGGNSSSLSSIVFGTNTVAVMWRIKTPSTLSTDTENYQLFAGFADVTTDNVPSDGAYFYYNHLVSNGVWTAQTANAASATFATGASTTVTVATSTWYNLLVEASATAADFWVSADDGATWTYVGRSTSNIPVTSARATGVETYIRKIGGTVGTTSRSFNVGRFVYWPNRVN